MEKFITANNTAIRIRDTIKGDRTILLLHGYLESLEVWDEFSEILRKDYRILTPDIPGHGISQVKAEVHTMAFCADVIHDALAQSDINKCLVVGHSMGGYVALELLRRHPDCVEGIVLLHSTPNPDSVQKKSDREREIEIIRAGRKELLGANASKGFAADNRLRYRNFIEDLKEQIYMTDDEGIVALLRGMSRREDLNSMLSQSSTPSLFIFGCKDEYIPVEIGESVAAKNPRTRVVWLEHSGHMGFVEQPQQCAAAITGFFDSITDYEV